MATNSDGERIFIPPGYGHVTINPSDHRTLVMANVVSNAFSSEYWLYEVMCGGVYYGLSGGEWVLNMDYSGENQMNGKNPGRKNLAKDKGDIPSLRPLKSEVFNELPALPLRQGTSIYRLAVEGESLLCLSEPERL